MSFLLLSPEQRTFFDTHGYLHIKSLVPEHVLNNVQQPINRWVNRIIKVWIKKGLIVDDFSSLPFETRLFHAWEAAKRPPYKEIVTQEIAGKEMFEFLTYAAFVKVVHDLLDAENIQALSGYMCRPKLPTSAFPIDTPWHQDAQCSAYHGKNDAKFLTIWVPLLDVDERNSCLQVSDGSHINTGVYEDAKNGTVHYSIHPEHSQRFENLRAIPMKRGDVLCLHQLVAHRALPNTTDKMRWSLDIRYESLPTSDIPVPKRGFVCAHRDSSLISMNHEDAFANVWSLYQG